MENPLLPPAEQGVAVVVHLGEGGPKEELGLVARPGEDEEEREAIQAFLDRLFGEEEVR